LTAVLAGLGAAGAFTCTSLLISHIAATVPAFTIAAVALVIGLAIVLPFVVWIGIPDGLNATSGCWLVVGGAAYVAGFLCSYTALGLGQVGAVTPIVSSEGAFAAIFAIIAGEQVGAPIAASLCVIAGGVILAASGSRRLEPTPERGAQRAVVLALGSAVLFGLALYAVGRASDDLPVAWVLLPTRLIGTVLVTVPLAVRSKIAMTGRAWPYVTAIAVLEAVGLASYAVGARESLAVTAVLTSQFAAFATVAAAILFRERLSRSQIAGLVTIVIGVTALSALHP
jgi:drug/metabolite transporter (DMT)-like permease